MSLLRDRVSGGSDAGLRDLLWQSWTRANKLQEKGTHICEKVAVKYKSGEK